LNILSIDIKNNRKIECFKTVLNGKNLEVAGETNTGKTTAISALWDILEKKSDSLKHGEKNGYVKIKIGDDDKWLIATRKHTAKTSTITIIDSEGDPVSVGDFKSMISSLSVNPHKIIEMKATQQTETLLNAANMGEFDLIAVDAEIEKVEGERLTAYRVMEALKPGVEPEKVEKVEINVLVDKKAKAVKTNTDNQSAKDHLVTLRADLVKNKETAEQYETDQINAAEQAKKESDTDITQYDIDMDEIHKRHDREVATLNTRMENKKSTNAHTYTDCINGIKTKMIICATEAKQLADRIVSGEKYTKDLEDIDIEPIDKELADIEETNQKATLYMVWKEKDDKHVTAADQHSDLDIKIKELRQSKKTALDSAQWPIPGLSIQDGNVIYNDFLLSNLGQSEQMLVCAALAIEDIKAHPMRVVRMDGIESMSKNDFESLKTLFNGHGIQILSTRVSRGDVDPEEITIIEGKYKAE